MKKKTIPNCRRKKKKKKGELNPTTISIPS